MQCPKCNYMMAPFDSECLRCARSQDLADKQAFSAPNQSTDPQPPPHDSPHEDEVRCPYCHEWVKGKNYLHHQNEHNGLRADGQYKEYVTLPPEDRDHSSLDGVPRVYYHHRCGSHTGMPEEIVRSYLRDPYLYYADQSFCGGCHRHIPCRELVWVETGRTCRPTTTDSVPPTRNNGLPGISGS